MCGCTLSPPNKSRTRRAPSGIETSVACSRPNGGASVKPEGTSHGLTGSGAQARNWSSYKTPSQGTSAAMGCSATLPPHRIRWLPARQTAASTRLSDFDPFAMYEHVSGSSETAPDFTYGVGSIADAQMLRNGMCAASAAPVCGARAVAARQGLAKAAARILHRTSALAFTGWAEAVAAAREERHAALAGAVTRMLNRLAAATFDVRSPRQLPFARRVV